MVKDGTVLAIPLHPAEGTSRSRATSIPRKRGGLVAKCDISRWRSSEKRVIYARQFVRSFALPPTDTSTSIFLVFSNRSVQPFSMKLERDRMFRRARMNDIWKELKRKILLYYRLRLWYLPIEVKIFSYFYFRSFISQYKWNI